MKDIIGIEYFPEYYRGKVTQVDGDVAECTLLGQYDSEKGWVRTELIEKLTLVTVAGRNFSPGAFVPHWDFNAEVFLTTPNVGDEVVIEEDFQK